MEQIKVTFKINKAKDSKSLSFNFDKEYSQEEKVEALEYIIDSILPTSPLDQYQYALGDAWKEYKWNKEQKKIVCQ